jgi:signal transduction histidine kinase
MLGIPLNAPKYRCVDAQGLVLDHDDYPAMVCLRTRQATTDQIVGIQRPDDSIRWVSACCQPILVDGGDGFAGVLSTIHDITERRNAEQARNASEAELRSFFHSAPLSMGVLQDLGDDLLIIRINEFGARAFGVEPEAMQGRTSSSLGVSLEHVQLWRHNLLASTQLASPVNFQYTHELAGQANWLSATVCPLAASAAQNRYCFVVDIITPRVRAEEMVRQQQVQIAHVQRLSSLGQMASELAHELNQPLFAIGNFAAASLQALDELPEQTTVNLRNWLGQIAAQADRAGQIVHRLHRFVRKTPTARQRLELGELTREALELVAIDARLHGVELECLESGTPIQVLVDRIQIQQVLVNLVLNGIEAMSGIEPAQRKLTIRVQLADAPEHAAIVVRDRGRGFGAIPVEQLFEPFFSTKPNGSGMGLAISREIARALGGELLAEPAPGAGAQFTVTLPLHESGDE